jgi:hypothetical protein
MCLIALGDEYFRLFFSKFLDMANVFDLALLFTPTNSQSFCSVPHIQTSLLLCELARKAKLILYKISPSFIRYFPMA